MSGCILEKCLNRGFFHILFRSYWVAVHTFFHNAIVKVLAADIDVIVEHW
jgi:hypothetical protein